MKTEATRNSFGVLKALDGFETQDSGFYADFFCAAGSLFACIDFTRSAAEAPSTDSP